MRGNGRNKRPRTAENGGYDHSDNLALKDTFAMQGDEGKDASSLQEQVDAIQSGTHPEYIKQVKRIEEVKAKKTSHAQQNRDDQIKNINELYDYELQDINSTYVKSCEELKQQLVSRLYDQTSQSERRSLSDNRSERNKPKNKKQQRGTVAIGIDKALPESDIRHDFVNIVRNMEDAALAFVKAHPSDVSASVSNSVLTITSGKEQNVYRVGSAVILTSNVTQEQLHGLITVINDIHIIVKLTSGPRLSIPLHHINQRRMVFSHDLDTNKDISLIINAQRLSK